MTQTILLTGISGYIAKHIALRLLDAGYKVRGSLRDLSRGAQVMQALRPHLAKPGDLEQRLSFVALDLDHGDGWDAAMTGIDVLMHCASPFPLAQPTDADALVKPAVDGTLRALAAAHRAGVSRAIVTSSTVAISGSPLPPGDSAFDETNWTDPDDPDLSAYGRSKTLAEQAAWAFVRDQAPDMALTVINPGFVLGAPLDHSYGTSVGVIARLLRGKDPMVPDIGFGTVDVRDVADLHVTCINDPGIYGQRIMAVDDFLRFQQIAQAIKSAHPNRRIATRVAPHFMVRLIGLFDPAVKSIVPNLGRVDKMDNSRARATLGRGMRRASVAAVDTADYLVREGLV